MSVTKESLERIKGLAISDNGFLFDTWTGNTYTLNSSATVILRGLQSGIDLDGIAARLNSEFDVDLPTARTDVEYFMDELAGQRIIEKEVDND